MMPTFLRRSEAIARLRDQGLSRRVWQQLIAGHHIEKVYIPPLAPGEDPASRRAFYSAASVARAVEQIQFEQRQKSIPATQTHEQSH